MTSILPKEPDLLVTLYNINFLMCSSQFVKRIFFPLSVLAVGLTFVFSLVKYVCLCCEKRGIGE